MVTISDEEKQKRRKALDFANASLYLSGFKTSAEEDARAEKFIEGSITLEQYVDPES